VGQAHPTDTLFFGDNRFGRSKLRISLDRTFLLLQKGVELPPIKDIKIDDFIIKKPNNGLDVPVRNET
jgi:hypothetical protein